MKKLPVNRSMLISAVFILLAGISCNIRGKQSQQVTTLQGTIENGKPARVVLYELDVKEIRAVDSVITGADGSFIFGTLITEPAFYQINYGTSDPLTLIALPGETITISAKTDSLVFARIEGSDESRLLQKYLVKSFINHQKTSQLGQFLADSRNHPQFLTIRDSIVSCFDSLFNDQQLFVSQFIRQNPTSLASLIAVNQRFGNMVLFDDTADRELFVLLDSGLRSRYPQSRHTLNQHSRLAEKARQDAIRELAAKALKPGKPAPYFRLRSIVQNEWLTPKDFLGQPCVVVFWVPGEARSSREIRQLKKILDNAPNPEIRVLAVALIRDTGLWETAVKEEGIAHWGHASDLKGSQSPVIQLYGLSDRLTFFYYLDSSGIIKGSNAHVAELLPFIDSE